MTSWLEDELRATNEEAYHDYKSMINKIRSMMDNWQGNLPHFTRHGEDHSVRVIERLEEIIPKKEDRTDRLREKLWWGPLQLLLYSSWFHDIGLGFNVINGVQLTPEEVRKLHNELGEKYTAEKWDYLNLKYERFGMALSKIILAHVKSVDIESIPEEFHAIKPICLRNLTALIRLADALDCDFRRKQWYDEEYRICPDPINKKHQDACGLIDSVTFNKDNKTIIINSHARGLVDRKNVLWYFIEHIAPDFFPVRDILNLNDINWVYIKLHINDDDPLSPEEAKKEFDKIVNEISTIPTADRFKFDLYECVFTVISNCLNQKTEDFWHDKEFEKLINILHSNSEQIVNCINECISPILHSYVGPQWDGVKEDFYNNVYSSYEQFTSTQMSEVSRILVDNLSYRLDDNIKRLFLEIILGYLSTHYQIFIKPEDLRVSIAATIDNNIIAKVYVRSLRVGNFILNEDYSIKPPPTEHYIERVAFLLRTETDLLKDQISGEPNSPGTKAVISNLMSHALGMPLNEYDVYLQKAIHSLLQGHGLLRHTPLISDDALTLRSQMYKKHIEKYNFLTQEKIMPIINDIGIAICNLRRTEVQEVHDVEQAFALYERLLLTVTEFFDLTDQLDPKDLQAPSIDNTEHVIRMFSYWPNFSSLPSQLQNAPVLAILILAYALMLYGFDESGNSSILE